jgi:hypothetical protein
MANGPAPAPHSDASIVDRPPGSCRHARAGVPPKNIRWYLIRPRDQPPNGGHYRG